MSRDPATHVGAVVKINGTEVPCDATSDAPGVLSGLKVTWGRSDRLSRPAASTCDFQLVDPDGGDDYAELIAYDSPVEVLGEDPNGTRYRIFYGHVTDLSLMHEPGTDAVVSVTAVDPTARLSSVMTGDTPWPEQTAAARRSAILSAIGGSTVLYWPAFEAGPDKYNMAAKDVDNQPAWEVINDFLWGIACIPWPIAYGSTGRPGLFITGQGVKRDAQLGIYDTREVRTEPVADFLTWPTGSGNVQYEIPTVCLDACDIDLDGTEFSANPDDTTKVVRMTYGTDDLSGVFVYKYAGDDPSRTFEVDSGLAYTSAYREIVAGAWYDQMSYWRQDFAAPWRVDVVRVDADTVTGVTDFNLALRRLLDQTYRINHNILLQRLPLWTPWRGKTTNTTYTEVVGLVQGGTYTYDEGRWVLELTITVERRLLGGLAPAPSLVVHPGDVVPYPHDTAEVTLVPDPATQWAIGEVATFTDGPYGWDGTAWVAGGVQPIVVRPGSTTTAAHDDPLVRAEPTTPWAARQYATFTDGAYQWNGSAWVAMVTVRAGDAVALAHDAPNVLPSPSGDWSTRRYATFTDGLYHWHGTQWLAMIVVGIGDEPGISNTDHRALADPSTAWPAGQYATFTNTASRWTGTTWQAMAYITPGTTTIYPPTAPNVMPVPSTPWAPNQYATMAGVRYQWNGEAWVAWYASLVVRPGDTPDRPHDAINTTPDPTTPWAEDEYATFTDGDYTWDGTGWAAWTAPPLSVSPGDVVDVPHDDPNVVAEPQAAWAEDDYATFSDGTWRWDGEAWVVYVAPLVVRPGDVVDVPHDDPNGVVAEPQAAWAIDTYATFSDGTYRWDGEAWVVYVAPLVVRPGDVVDVAHDDPNVAPDPATAWPDGQTATFTDGAYTWDGEVWVVPSQRVNLALDPHAAIGTGWSWQSGTFGAATVTTETGTDTPDGRAGYRRATITTPDTGGYGGHVYERSGVDGQAGDVVTLSLWVRTSEAGTYALYGSTRSGATTSESATGPVVNVPAEVWTRVDVTITTTKPYDGLRAAAMSRDAGPAVGATVDATMVLLEDAPALRPYFDGGTPATDTATYAWTGAANASTSVMTPGEPGPPDYTWSGAPEGTAWSDVPAGTSWTEWTGEA